MNKAFFYETGLKKTRPSILMILIQLLAFTKYKIPYLKWGKKQKQNIKRTCCPKNLIYSFKRELFNTHFLTSFKLNFFLKDF